MQFSSIWPIDRIRSGASIQGQSWPGRNGNEGVLHIPKSPNIGLFSVISGHSLGDTYKEFIILSYKLLSGEQAHAFWNWKKSFFITVS